ncbi:hypothetical protein, partial [Pseudomonas sp. FG-3G]
CGSTACLRFGRFSRLGIGRPTVIASRLAPTRNRCSSKPCSQCGSEPARD